MPKNPDFYPPKTHFVSFFFTKKPHTIWGLVRVEGFGVFFGKVWVFFLVNLGGGCNFLGGMGVGKIWGVVWLEPGGFLVNFGGYGLGCFMVRIGGGLVNPFQPLNFGHKIEIHRFLGEYEETPQDVLKNTPLYTKKPRFVLETAPYCTKKNPFLYSNPPPVFY